MEAENVWHFFLICCLNNNWPLRQLHVKKQLFWWSNTRSWPWLTSCFMPWAAHYFGKSDTNKVECWKVLLINHKIQITFTHIFQKHLQTNEAEYWYYDSDKTLAMEKQTFRGVVNSTCSVVAVVVAPESERDFFHTLLCYFGNHYLTKCQMFAGCRFSNMRIWCLLWLNDRFR